MLKFIGAILFFGILYLHFFVKSGEETSSASEEAQQKIDAIEADRHTVKKEIKVGANKGEL